jgi:hypothetical protein
MDPVQDMVAARIGVEQIDSRCIAVAARYEDSLDHYDGLCERENPEPPVVIGAAVAPEGDERVSGLPGKDRRDPAGSAPRTDCARRPQPKVGGDPWQDL